jgi:hypothetical protein
MEGTLHEEKLLPLRCYLANGAGFKGTAGCAATRASPHGGYSTEMVEPCGALPRRCSFIYSFIYVGAAPRFSAGIGRSQC